MLSDPVGNQRLHFLGDTIFARARELGLNLIGTVVHPDSVETMIESNAVHEICDAAAPGGPLPDLGVAVLDFGILEKLAGERIMLHPESELDFSERGEYEPQGGQQFDDLPISHADLASPLTIASPTYRCVRIEPGKGEISGVVELRKRDLSMYRAWRDADNNREDEGISGLYVISVTVQAIEPGSFNENPTPLMNLDIMTVDSTHNTPARADCGRIAPSVQYPSRLRGGRCNVLGLRFRALDDQ